MSEVAEKSEPTTTFTNDTNKKTIEPSSGELLSPSKVRFVLIGLIRERSSLLQNLYPFASSLITSIETVTRRSSSSSAWDGRSVSAHMWSSVFV